MKKMVQVTLRSGETTRVCWLEEGVKTGNRVTLKNAEDSQRLWEVTWVSKTSRQLDEIPRGWNNNI